MNRFGTVSLVLFAFAFVAACDEDAPPGSQDSGGLMDGGALADGGDASAPVDAGPPEPCESPGATESVPCGACGTIDRFCTAAGVWSYGVCTGEGVCTPDSVDSVACGRCGTQEARCTASCTWEASGECTGEGVCEPGARSRGGEGCAAGSTREQLCTDACVLEGLGECVADGCTTPGVDETVACGMCGTQSRFCTAERTWVYEACEGERTCMAGATRTASCGMCGSMTERCDATCTWVPGECAGEGCTPGTTMRTGAGCPAAQTRLLRCSSACAFTEVVEACSAPSVDAGPPDTGPPGDAGPPTVTIGQVQRGEVAAGTVVVLRGVVVTAVRSDAVWVQEPVGTTYAGVRVYLGSGSHGLVRNDRVDVEGSVGEYFGDTEIGGAATAVVVGTAPAIAARALTVAQAATEPYEGMLVRLTDVSMYMSPYDCSVDSPLCFDADLWEVNGATGIVVSDRVYEGSDWISRVGAASVTGVMSWRFGRRRISPRIAADLP